MIFSLFSLTKDLLTLNFFLIIWIVGTDGFFTNLKSWNLCTLNVSSFFLIVSKSKMDTPSSCTFHLNHDGSQITLSEIVSVE